MHKLKTIAIKFLSLIGRVIGKLHQTYKSRCISFVLICDKCGEKEVMTTVACYDHQLDEYARKKNWHVNQSGTTHHCPKCKGRIK